MLAKRICLFLFSIAVGSVVSVAQDLPLRKVIDPLADVEPVEVEAVLESQLTSTAREPLPLLDAPICASDEVVHTDPQRLDASPGIEHGHESDVSPQACTCGNRRCHGVCRDPGRPKKPRKQKPGDVDRGDCPPLRYRISDHDRAGNPHCVARWAKCGVTDKYSAWYVGGGAAFFRGRCRTSDEGTWGLDYDGLFGRVNNWLTYTRGRVQGGEGAYETDGEPEFVSRVHERFGHGH